MKQAAGYEEDFFEWTQTTAELLRSGRLDAVDADNIAEEIEGLGNRDKREVVSRLRVLIMHLLKWSLQAEDDDPSRSWRSTIRTQREDLDLVLKDSPSLRARLPEWIRLAYPRAATEAVNEMRLRKNPFPAECPYSPAQIIDSEFWPND